MLDFWQKEIVDASRSSEFGDLKGWFISKFSAFLSNDMMRNIIGQNKSSFNFRDIMNQGKILIVNLSLGRVGELNMKLLGMIFVTKFHIAAMSRANMSESDRTPFTLYVDEFQNFATDSFARILSEARKYKLSLIVANQHTAQLQEDVRDSILGNVGTAVSFRINASDAEILIKQFYSPVFSIDDLTRLPLGSTVIRTLINGTPTLPFNMITMLPLGEHDNNRIKNIEKQLLSTHGRPRAEVEKEIFARLDLRKIEDNQLNDHQVLPSIPSRFKRPNMDKPFKSSNNTSKPMSFAEEWLKKKKELQLEHNSRQEKVSQDLAKHKQMKRQIFKSEDDS